MKLCCYMATPGGMTGAPRRLLMLCRALRERGLEVCVVSDRGSDLITAAQREGQEIWPLESPELLTRRRRTLFRPGLIFRARILAALLLNNLRLRAIIARCGAHATWIRGSKGIVFGGFGARLACRPLVWDVDYELPSRGVLRVIHWIALRLSSIVIFQYRRAPEEIFGADWTGRYGQRFRAVLPGVDVDRLLHFAAMRRARRHRREEPFRILQVGTICERKNQRFLLKVLYRAREERGFGHWRLDLTFDENQDPGFQALVEKLRLSEHVRLLGWRDDIQDLMVNADLLAMPSLAEGVPNAVQEAMVIGLPVIASRAGGIPEILEAPRGGWSLPLDDEDSWLDTIIASATDRELCRRVGMAGTEFALQTFGLERWADAYMSAIGKSCNL